MTRDRSDQVTFSASRAMRDALDLEAFAHDESRSATIRRLVLDYLRRNSLIGTTTAPTVGLGRHNHLYNQSAK